MDWLLDHIKIQILYIFPTALLFSHLCTFSYLFFREIPDYSLEMIDKFLASVVEAEQTKEKRSCRGPYLAQLELEKLCSQECIHCDSRQSELLGYMYWINLNVLCHWTWLMSAVFVSIQGRQYVYFQGSLTPHICAFDQKGKILKTTWLSET